MDDFDRVSPVEGGFDIRPRQADEADKSRGTLLTKAVENFGQIGTLRKGLFFLLLVKSREQDLL